MQIVKVEDIKDEKTQSLNEATSEITRLLKTEKGKREAAVAADRDREKALAGTDFVKLAQDSGVALNVTRWFTTGEVLPEVGQNQEFYKSALSMSPKDISPVIEGTNSYHLLRLKQRKEPAVPPLESVKPTIEKELTESKAHELARQKGSNLLDQLKKEKDITRVAEANGLKVEETGWFLRNAPQLPKIGEFPEFKAGGIALSAQKPIPDKIYTQKASVYIFAFKESQGADMDRFEKEKDLLLKQALAESKQRVAQKFMEGLKANAKIHVNPSLLEEG